jgi:RimJ/RimL family protein N-acetyltransferase
MVPMEHEHAQGLLEAADKELFRYIPWTPSPWNLEGYQRFVKERQEGGSPFVVIEKATGKVLGMSSYLDIQPLNKVVEIGFTWITKSHRGTKVNPEMKLLMLGYAFKEMDCNRVQLRTDERNAHSRAAILKLGAQYEGMFRHNVIMEDGHLRNTVYYSVLRAEWQSVQNGLLARLAGDQ